MNPARIRRTLVWLAGALAAYALIGFLIVPAVVKHQTIEHVERDLGHRLEVGELHFNPFTLAVEVSNVALKESTGPLLLGFKRLFVNFQARSVFRRTWTFSTVEIDAPELHFEHRADGSSNFDALLAQLLAPSPEPDAPMPRLHVERIQVSRGQLRLADLQAGADARLTLEPIAFELTDLSTLPSESAPYKLTARSPDGESIHWGGEIALNPFSSTGKLALQNWRIATLDRLLGTRIGLYGAKGQIDIALDYRASFAQGKPALNVANARLTLDGLQFATTEGAAPLIDVKRFTATGGSFDLVERTASLERIEIDRANVNLGIDESGRENWSALTENRQQAMQPSPAAPATDVAPQAATPDSPPWNVKLGRLAGTEMALAFTDKRAAAPAGFTISQGKVETSAALRFGPAAISVALDDLVVTTGTVAANRATDTVTLQSLQLALTALKLQSGAKQSEVTLDRFKLGVAAAAATTRTHALRLDNAELVVPGATIALGNDSAALPAATMNSLALELRGVSARAGSAKELIAAKSISIGTQQLRFADARVLDLNAEGIRASLGDAVVREADASTPAARLGKLEATGGTLSTARRTLTLERLGVADAHAAATYAPDGRLNWDRLLTVILPASAAPKPAAAQNTPPAAPEWQIAAKLIEFDRVGAAYRDARQTPPLAIAVQDVRGRIRNAATTSKSAAGIEMSGRVIDSGKFRIAGTVDPNSLATDLKLKVDAISLTAAQPFVAQYARLQLVSGLAAAEGRLRYGKPKEAGARLVFEGDIGLDQLDIKESEPVQPFLALGTLRATQVKLTLDPNGLDIPDLRLSGLATKLLIAEDQSINLLKVLRTAPVPDTGAAINPTDPGPRAATSTAPVVKPTPEPQPDDNDVFPVTIGRMRIDRSQLEFADLSLRPQLFSTRMQELQGVITGISTSRDSRARLELDARVDEFGAAIIRGSINPFRPRAYTEVDLDFRNIAMTNLTPYATKFAGYRIASGQLTMNLQYRVKNSALQGNNKIVLDNLELGERVESPTAMNLPLEFAIAILKDSNGRIDIGLPVTGSLDDPQFSIAGLVWKAIGNLITNIVTAPFRALASLFGGGQNETLGSVEFDAGSDALRPPERQKLRTVGEALQKRPQLKLTVKPTIARAADGEAIKSFHMRRGVLARAGIKLEPGESPGPLDVNSPRMQQAIDAAFIERFGLPAARDLRASLAKPIADEATSLPQSTAGQQTTPVARQNVRIARVMATRLQEAIEVSEGELAELGKRRAAAILAELRSVAKIDAIRIASDAPTSSDVKEGQVVSELTLSVAK